ncbi:type II toxin-antitoxin system mRNA interferase toxin, RelE/StbE family [Candidatus Gracilibacteria bacterium]|nr:type II toxin-antitoxin system mRNA interferase toxin, RelE/StbE family [Candidatus Gracilibacteria bacterium]
MHLWQAGNKKMILFKKHKRFEKSFRKLSPKLQEKTSEVLKIFTNNKHDIRLKNHALKGDFIGFRSINLTGDYRIIFKDNDNGVIEVIELVDVNTHSELYK